MVIWKFLVGIRVFVFWNMVWMVYLFVGIGCLVLFLFF